MTMAAGESRERDEAGHRDTESVGPPRDSRAVIVVPCFNEERRLAPQRFSDYVGRTSSVSFLFVDDGSSDRTSEILSRMVQSTPARMSAIRMPRNSGKAEAVRAGIQIALKAEPDFVGFWDADLATPLEAIDDLLEVFRSQPHVAMVFGARVKLLGRTIERQVLRHLAGRAFATMTSLVLKLPIYDTQCGAKIFRNTPRVGEYFAEPFLTRWIFDVEILARALTTSGGRADLVGGGRIVEFPLYEWQDVKGSKLKPRDFVAAAEELLRIWVKYRP